MVDLDGVELPDYASVIEILVDFILPDGMFDVVFFDLFWPAIVEVMDFASNFFVAI